MDSHAWLNRLRTTRPVFHSEADFQHASAWVIREEQPALQVRLETRPAPGVHLDVAVHDLSSGRTCALELKYLTAGWSGVVDGEGYQLLNQGAQDIRAYDVVKDIWRIEQLVLARPAWRGAVIVLTNDPAYWARPSHGRVTNADAFRVYDGNTLSGHRGWGPSTGAGTSRGRDAVLELAGSYSCCWAPFSILQGRRGEFRSLVLTVDSVVVTSGRHTNDHQERPDRSSSRTGGAPS